MKSKMKLAFTLLLALGLSACEVAEIPTSAADPQNALIVNLEKKQQMVRRFDCRHQVISFRLETLTDPTVTFEITPLRADNKNGISRSRIHNVTTDYKKDSNFGSNKFTINMEVGRDMPVQVGLNEIAYEFEYYDGQLEKSSRFINVTYKEVMLKDILDVYPFPSDCYGGNKIKN